MKLFDIILENISGDWGNESPQSTSDVEVKCLRSADIVPIYQFDYSGIPFRYVSQKSMEARILHEGDIVIEKSGGTNNCSTGRPIYISGELLENNEPLLCSNFCSAIRLKKDWNPRYVYYYLRLIHKEGLFFNFEGKTSGIHNLDMDAAFKAIDIPEISYPEQEQVAKILSSLDRKIALNRKINAELEQMAKELYDYWFVQFDFPNSEGKPYKSSGGKMVYNPQLKRDIPEGWEVKSLLQTTRDELESLNPSDNPNQIFKHYSIPAFDSCNFYAEELGANILSSKNIFSSDDILVSKLNPWTSRVVWGFDDENLICSTEFVALSPKNKKEKGFVYMLAKSKSFITYCTKASTGTSHSHRRVNSKIMQMFKYPYQQNTIERYSNIVGNYAENILLSQKEISRLSSLRDQLLPLLMNGQVKIK